MNYVQRNTSDTFIKLILRIFIAKKKKKDFVYAVEPRLLKKIHLIYNKSKWKNLYTTG